MTAVGAPRRVAVVGAGVSGLTAAHLLARRGPVTLFEAEPRAGGHAHTHDIRDRDGRALAVDTGFIVHNDRTYPQLRRLFTELGVRARPTQMSMSIHCRQCGLEYAGGKGVGGILARPRGLADRRFVGLLAQVRRLHRLASAWLDADSRPASGASPAGPGAPEDDTTLGRWLAQRGFTAYFVEHYAIPLVSCVWSTGRRLALDYPARYLFTFLRHHGMLSIGGSPTWFTVQGGSRAYVDALLQRLPDVRLGAPVTGIERVRDGVRIETGSGVQAYDAVVVATHSDTALALLRDPTRAEREVLGAIGYASNETVLHTDASLLPPSRRAHASWNYAMPSCAAAQDSPVVTYSMNLLHGLPGSTPHLVTLNAGQRIAPDARLATMTYRHPVYTAASVGAQRRLPELTTATTAFAGAYHGWGFHEDGCRSGVAAASAFGAHW